METVACPGCAQPMTRVVSHGVHYRCGSCRGVLLGLVPFEDLLAPGDGARVWQQAQAGPTAGRCPFCSGDMHAPTSEPDAGGLAVCRRCQQVWLPPGAKPWLAAHAAPVPPPRQPDVPSECPSCGAPYSPDADGQCRFCRAHLVAPTVVVVAPPAPDDRGRSAGALGQIGDLIDSVIDVLADL